MKTTQCFTLTLLIIVTLAFVPNSSAQETAPEFIVQIVYFVPKDREPDPNMGTTMDTLIKDVQQFYAGEMERHGFGRKTFKFETDENGDAIVHQVIGKYNDAEYVNRNQTGSQEIRDQFDTSTSRNILIMLLDYSSQLVCGRSGYGGGYGGGGSAILPASGHCFTFRTIAHELGHGFGLFHDFRSNEYMMSYGADRNKLSYCTVDFLDVSRYFNPGSEGFNYSNSNVQLLTSSFVSSPANIRFSFEVTDPDGLHQAQLMIPDDNLSVVACQSLDGQSATVEFVTDELHDTDDVDVVVVDVLGNIAQIRFTIDITDLLPPSEAISMPDSNLAAAIREELDLAAGSPITALNMLGLETLGAQNKQIKNLTGLEHATNLRSLFLDQNQIEDITSLTGLKQLRRLLIHRNKIMDVTPLTQLTNLTTLNLGDNQIRDVAPLAGLTRLRNLSLWHNQISNVGPITGLTDLEALQLVGNQISDLGPLAGLKKLKDLALQENQISDVNPLAELKNLDVLSLNSNKLSDVSPLAGLTRLSILELRDNQISNVSPLTELVNLERLDLIENPIKNRQPLLDLLQKNPNVKIYLKSNHKPLPVTLSHFWAEHTDAGVVLKWATESEVDNAGFDIYRSPTKDGDFKVVNSKLIQGAGTTGERHTYTWTDTTAKPNTVYYYRIEDVSHAGVRKQLATVRLRGFVSARGKFTTSWADLKAQN